MTKICCKCKQETDIGLFGKDQSRKDGLNPMCKLCRKISTRNYYLSKHKPYVKKTEDERKEQRKLHARQVYIETPEIPRARARASRKTYNQRLKLAAFNAYGGPICNCCGETNTIFLTIDHINNDGGHHRKTFTTNFYNWLKSNNYPEGFQVLCWNCNMGKNINGGVCPHQQEEHIVDLDGNKAIVKIPNNDI